MLQVPYTLKYGGNPAAGATVIDGVKTVASPVLVDGKKLAWVRGANALKRTIFAADLYTGAKQLYHLTEAQCCFTTNANTTYLNAYLNASPDDQFAVQCGVKSLAELCAQRKTSPEENLRKSAHQVGLEVAHSMIVEMIAARFAHAAQ